MFQRKLSQTHYYPYSHCNMQDKNKWGWKSSLQVNWCNSKEIFKTFQKREQISNNNWGTLVFDYLELKTYLTCYYHVFWFAFFVMSKKVSFWIAVPFRKKGVRTFKRDQGETKCWAFLAVNINSLYIRFVFTFAPNWYFFLRNHL